MPQLKNGSWEAPFWGASKKFITGQDMLGMQNTSIATYAKLLPGLTNLTRRIRYYGFYVWMLEQYAKLIGQISVTEFQKFMRRGELLLAFVISCKSRDEVGVVGSQYARNYLDKNIDPVELATGADRDSTEKIYWQYSSGAFGQYYQGSLTALGLIAPNVKNKNIFVSTPDYGRQLAHSFEKMFSNQLLKLFLNVIDSGKISLKDLDNLSKGFSLNGIEPKSDEWQFYIDMLFDNDFPTINLSSDYLTFRKETILLYMEYCNNKELSGNSVSFPRSFYYQFWTHKPFIDYPASQGWYYYALNEFGHYCIETFLWAMLVDLNTHGISYLPELVNRFSCESISVLKADESILKITDNIDFKTFAESQYQSEINIDLLTEEIYQIQEDQPYVAVKKALQILAYIYYHDKKQLKQLHSYSHLHSIYRNDDVVDLLEWIEKYEELPLTDFVNKILLRHVINRHIEVAMRKMLNRNENTLKFLFENNYLKTVAIAEPLWTGPRIDSLHRFLVDLKLLNEKNELTSLGQQILVDKLK